MFDYLNGRNLNGASFGGIFVSLFLLLWIYSSNSSAIAKPCPPGLYVKEYALSLEEVSCTSAIPSSTAEESYGPIIGTGEQCPGIPARFSKVHRVRAASQFWNAVRALSAGDAIIVEDGMRGTGWAGSIPKSAGGSRWRRSYILSETVHGAKLEGFSRWTVEASNITIAGFERTNSADAIIRGDNVRWACNKNNGVAGKRVIVVPDDNPVFHDDLEIDNNTFLNGDWEVYFNAQCQIFSWTCLGSNRGHHIHNNYFHSDRGAQGHNMVYLGLGWSPESLTSPGKDEKNRQEAIFENNWVQWKQASGDTSLNVKSSGNVLRNNCFNDTNPIGVRMGNDNLITGNWYRGKASFPNWKTPGWRNVVVFNYFGDGQDRWPAFTFFQGSDDQRQGAAYSSSPYIWSYYSTSDGIYSNNVFNRYRHFIEVHPLIDPTNKYLPLLPERYKPIPENNRIENNIVRTASYLGDFESSDNSVTEQKFRELNPDWNTNNQILSEPITVDPPCGTPGVVNGLGDRVRGHRGLHEGTGWITAPSWWN